MKSIVVGIMGYIFRIGDNEFYIIVCYAVVHNMGIEIYEIHLLRD